MATLRPQVPEGSWLGPPAPVEPPHPAPRGTQTSCPARIPDPQNHERQKIRGCTVLCGGGWDAAATAPLYLHKLPGILLPSFNQFGLVDVYFILGL